MKLIIIIMIIMILHDPLQPLRSPQHPRQGADALIADGV